MLKLGWFSTGRGEGSRGFLDLVQGEIQSGRLDAQIEFVFSNREPGEANGSDIFLELVKRYGIPLVTLSSQRYRAAHGRGPMYKFREPFHDEVMNLITEFPADIYILAGYMLITSPKMCHLYPMINLHPALPGGPTGTWQQVIWQLIKDDATTSGVMFHLVTDILDGGPVLSYCEFPINGGEFEPLWKESKLKTVEELISQGEDQPLFKKIRQEGIVREGPLLLATLRALIEKRVNILGSQILDSEGLPMPGTCMNEEIEQILRGRTL